MQLWMTKREICWRNGDASVLKKGSIEVGSGAERFCDDKDCFWLGCDGLDRSLARRSRFSEQSYTVEKASDSMVGVAREHNFDALLV